MANAQNSSNAKVEILRFAAFYKEGARGSMGGAAQNDKVWGVAKINGTLVSFHGRRNGKLKFKTFLIAQSSKLLDKYADKIGGRTDGGDIYTPVNNPEMRATLCPNLVADVTSHYYSDMARGKLNTLH